MLHMNHYTYTATLTQIWSEAVEKYKAGQRGHDTFFSDEQLAFLASVGLKSIEVYDYAEDFCGRDEPDLATFVAVHDIRRAYFLEVQKGVASNHEIDMDALPPKADEVEGIGWLPRILPKARAKLQGEAPTDLMYGCGGDRRFFKENNIHPAEFLRLVWENFENDQAIIDWVKARRSTAPQPAEV